jgi:hypothetical protein
MAVNDAVKEAPLPSLAPDGAALACRNCGAIAPGKYCSACGQSTKVEVPSLHEFLHEFVTHHVAFEGTLVASLKRLLLTPGGLTLDYFAGKRARYVAPLRLYLTFNVIFFLAIEIAQSLDVMRPIKVDGQADAVRVVPVETADSLAKITSEIDADEDLPPEERKKLKENLGKVNQALSAALPAALPDPASVSRLPGKEGNVPQGDDVPEASDDAKAKQSMEKAINRILPEGLDHRFPTVRKRLEEFINLSAQGKMDHVTRNLVHYAPYTLLAMLPICAFLLLISFVGSKRRYVEHLVAALHGHTFLFIVLLFALLPIGGWFGLVFVLALLHMVLALRKIYPGNATLLFFRLSFLVSTYFFALLFATFFALAASVIT